MQMAISAAVHTSYREVEVYLGGLATCLHSAYREVEVQDGGVAGGHGELHIEGCTTVLEMHLRPLM